MQNRDRNRSEEDRSRGDRSHEEMRGDQGRSSGSPDRSSVDRSSDSPSSDESDRGYSSSTSRKRSNESIESGISDDLGSESGSDIERDRSRNEEH